MFGYLAVVGLLLMALIIFVAVLFVIVIVMVDFLKGLDSHIGFFASIFLALLSISVMLLAITFGLAVTFYGTAFLVFQGKGAFVSVKEAIQYIYNKQSAYWLYCIVFGASVVAAIILMLMGLPFNEIPVVGVFIALPYQFFTYVVQSYLGLFSLAVIFVYFYSGISVDASIQASDTFVQGDPGQGGIPPQ
jgi:hypothetical protein